MMLNFYNIQVTHDLREKIFVFLKAPNSSKKSEKHFNVETHSTRNIYYVNMTHKALLTSSCISENLHA